MEILEEAKIIEHWAFSIEPVSPTCTMATTPEMENIKCSILNSK